MSFPVYVYVTYKTNITGRGSMKGPTCRREEMIRIDAWINETGRSWGLTPVILALWEAEKHGSLESRSLGLAWPTWWNPHLHKK